MRRPRHSSNGEGVEKDPARESVTRGLEVDDYDIALRA